MTADYSNLQPGQHDLRMGNSKTDVQSIKHLAYIRFYQRRGLIVEHGRDYMPNFTNLHIPALEQRSSPVRSAQLRRLLLEAVHAYEVCRAPIRS